MTAELDFLSLRFEGEAVRRADSVFETLSPWALARFGPHTLRGGWWVFECETKGDLRGVEVRLSSAAHPLIVIAAEQAEGYRLHFQGGDPFEISVLLSPWPGKTAFGRLRMRRLDFGEELQMMATGAQRLMHEEKPLVRVARAAGRILSGRTIGIRTTPQRDPPAVPAPAEEPSIRGAKIYEYDGVVAVLGDGDLLHPRALALVKAEFARGPEVKAIYADVSEGGAIRPLPQWDAELAAHVDYVGGPVFFRSGADDAARAPQASLRAFAAADPRAVRRIPLPLAEHAPRARAPLPPLPVPDLPRTPSVSAIIPTKFRVDLLELCLQGLAETDYPDLEAIIVDNGCEDPRFASVLEAAAARIKLTKVEDFGPFNFPRLIASGVAKASGEVLLLLNDDVQSTEPGWLRRMVASVLDPTVGAVGARLTYPDRTVQHAGVMLGIGGACGHLWKGTAPEEAAASPLIAYPGQRSAVTGACMMVRREAYDRAGGLDSEAFPVSFNDIDFCLRLNVLGLRNIYRGDAVLVHHESQSRGADGESEQKRRRLAAETGRFLARWRHRLADDPFGSPAFDLAQESGAVHRSLRRNAV